jgi:hypothetical protein
MRYITVDIYKRNNASVSPLNSISSRYDRVALPCVDGPLEESEISGIPVIKLVRRKIAGREYVHAEPEGDTRLPMYGGCILDTSDSRFHETTGVSYPIKLHDRYEHPPISAEAQELLRPEWEATQTFIREPNAKLARPD